ncbi:MAG: Linoleoyl-CoA desaturase [Bacteroidetes bacterium]|nr:Linoleoyl-CoA desaturase [Bacteroidota bacterium]
MKTKIKFTNKDKTQFFSVLKQRVDNYFIENNISQHANATMVVKTIVMLSLYFVPVAIIYSQSVGTLGLWICSAVMGLGLAGIGMSVMHDANHDAYSANPTINKLIALSLTIVGGDNRNWKTQHNVLHHTYTNIYEHDRDIDNKVIMRFSPAGKHKKIQRFQVVYVFFFYSIMSLYWIMAKDIVQFIEFNKGGQHRDSTGQKAITLLKMLFWKAIYFTYMIVLPITYLHIPGVYVLIGFLTLHAIAGLILSIVFQLAHVVENTIFPEPDEKGNIDSEWAIHQLQTTADFARNNWLITYYVGGLNFQAIHHLFPRICHVHYPKIAPIVAETAKEFGVPYIYNESFTSAFISHIRLIRQLGRDEIKPGVLLNNMG